MVTLGNEPAARTLAAAGNSERFYSVSEAAAHLGVSRISIWRWIRDGRLPAARLGHRTIRISSRDVDRLLAPNGLLAARSASVGSAQDDAPRGRWWEVQASEHLVQFYESDGFLIDAVSEFIGSALRSGDGAVVVATPVHREDLLARLADHGLDVDTALRRHQLVSLDAAQTLSRFMVDGVPDPERFHLVVGDVITRALDEWQRVRAFGEMVALLATHGEQRAAVRLEGLWNELQQQRVFSLMCAYPIHLLGGEPMAPFVKEVCRDHSRIVPAESYSGLDQADARLRAIALLQQRARTLELEVAARARVERELRRREAELRDFLEQGTLGLHWVDGEGTILWANQAELDLLGYTADEYVGRQIGDFYADRDVADDILERLIKRETIREGEVRLRHKSGAIRHALVSSNVLWDGDTFVHTRCFTVDISRRKLAEQRLALQYAVTRALSESRTLAEAGAATLHHVGEALGWQAGGLWLIDQYAGVLRCRDFWRGEDMDTAEFEAVSRSLRLQRGEGLPGRVWASGEPAWIADVVADPNFSRKLHASKTGLHGAVAFPVTVGGEVVGVVEFFSRAVEEPGDEIAAVMAAIGGQFGQFIERKRAEAEAELERKRLREVFEHAPAAVALLRGPRQVFEFVNPTYVQTLGRREAAELVGKPLRAALPELESQGLFELVENVYESGQRFEGKEVRVVLAACGGANEEAFFDVQLQPSRDELDQVDGVIVHAVNVTEQVRARQRIEALLTARDEFLASAAHDLKNPLANMKAQAQLLHRRVSRAGAVQTEDVLRGLASVDGSASRMALLIDDLLDVARLELGQELELQRGPTDLVALTRRVLAEHQQSTESHELRLEALPSLVGEWDSKRLDRVLTNLLDNALKYSPDGGQIVVGIRQDGATAVLTVQDEGLGIPEADLPHIFERFRRGANVAGRIGGTGIGLAGVRALVESHGGSIAAASKEGSGSTFTLRLPLGADVADSGR